MNDIDKNNQSVESDLGLSDYINLLKFHLFKFLLILAIGFPLSVYLTYSKIPIYQSKVSIMVQENSNSSFIMDFNGTRSQDRILNEIQKIKSIKINGDTIIIESEDDIEKIDSNSSILNEYNKIKINNEKYLLGESVEKLMNYNI